MEWLQPFEFEDEHPDPAKEGQFIATSVGEWMKRILTRTKKVPILVCMEATEVLKEYKDGGVGLLASKAHFMKTMLPGSVGL